jgi:hypothetical protein
MLSGGLIMTLIIRVVQDFVRPGSERGLRLDVDRRHPPMVVTDRIAPENMQRLLSQIQSAHGA